MTQDGLLYTVHIAAHLGNNKFVKLLLKNGNSAAYVRNKEGLFALHIAVKETSLSGFIIMFVIIRRLMCLIQSQILPAKSPNILP